MVQLCQLYFVASRTPSTVIIATSTTTVKIPRVAEADYKTEYLKLVERHADVIVSGGPEISVAPEARHAMVAIGGGARKGSISVMSALGQKQIFAVQKGMPALPPIATAKANPRKNSCPLYPRKRIFRIRDHVSGRLEGSARLQIMIDNFAAGCCPYIRMCADVV
jgi:hypothetical protein